MGARENKFQQLQISLNEIVRKKFYVCFLNSCTCVTENLFFSVSNYEIVYSHLIIYGLLFFTYSPSKV